MSTRDLLPCQVHGMNAYVRPRFADLIHSRTFVHTHCRRDTAQGCIAVKRVCVPTHLRLATPRLQYHLTKLRWGYRETIYGVRVRPVAYSNSECC